MTGNFQICNFELSETAYEHLGCMGLIVNRPWRGLITSNVLVDCFYVASE